MTDEVLVKREGGERKLVKAVERRVGCYTASAACAKPTQPTVHVSVVPYAVGVEYRGYHGRGDTM